MKRTLSFLLPAAAMLLAACGGANDRPSFPDFQEMADPAAAFADWSAAGDTPCASFVTTDRRFGKSQLPDVEPRTACRLTAWRGERGRRSCSYGVRSPWSGSSVRQGC